MVGGAAGLGGAGDHRKPDYGAGGEPGVPDRCNQENGMIERRPYTGPTSVDLKSGSMHINGYPDSAHVRRLNGPLARRLAHLKLHSIDLLNCKLIVAHINSERDNEDRNLSYFLWISYLAKFYSCFSPAASRNALDAKTIYGSIPVALDVFWYYKNIRDKHIIHDENNFNYSETAVVMGSNFEIHDILSLIFTSLHDVGEDIDNLHNLADAALQYVNAQIEAILPKIFAEVRGLSLEQLANLDPVDYKVPMPGDEYKRR
jgi:hypothetical protein